MILYRDENFPISLELRPPIIFSEQYRRRHFTFHQYVMSIKQNIKKYLVAVILGIGLSLQMVGVTHAVITNAPTFDNDFKKHLLTDPSGKGEKVYDPATFAVSANNTLKQNIYNLVSPGNDSSKLRVAMRIIMIGVLVLHFAWSGIMLILNADDEGKRKAATRSFYYMVFGAFLIYGVTRILGKALAIETVGGSQGFVQNLITRVLFQILGFLKAFAFFWAIVMTVWYGIQMMRAMDKEDAIKTARTGLTNVLMTLVFIKVIDFIFFIAQDVSFASKAKMFMLNIARI